MGVDEIIETIQKENLLEFFFELDGEFFEKYDRYLDEDETDLINTEEKEEKYLKKLGLQNYEDKGGRCDTSQFWNVVYFPDYDVYIKISGWYDSYGNYEHGYNKIEEVKPKQVTTTIYQ